VVEHRLVIHLQDTSYHFAPGGNGGELYQLGGTNLLNNQVGCRFLQVVGQEVNSLNPTGPSNLIPNF